MPELPEAERGRKLAHDILLNKKLVQIKTDHDDIVYSGISPQKFAQKLKNRTVIQAHRKGKYIWLEMDQGPHPLFHFGMTGNFTTYEKSNERPRFWKVEFLTDDGKYFSMTNKRKLGRIMLLDDPENQAPLNQLGSDPLLNPPTSQEIYSRLNNRKAPIKALLLNQKLFAGVGNWVADEILYQAKIAPERRANELSLEEIKLLTSKLNSILKKAVEVNADDEKFPKSWLFHYRWGKNKQAQTHDQQKIVFSTVGGRTSAWVPTVQI